jgi:hypothetical protein
MPAETMRDHSKPETPDIAARRVVLIVVGFLAFVTAALGGLYIYFGLNVPDTVKLGKAAFPEPRLQLDPHGDLRRLQATQKETISEYGWVDKGRGLIRIPIDRAMAFIVARGKEALDPLDKPAVTPTPGGRGGAAP